VIRSHPIYGLWKEAWHSNNAGCETVLHQKYPYFADSQPCGLEKIEKMSALAPFQEAFKAYLESRPFSQFPEELYEPVDYILSIGGKRIRPVALLMGYALYQEDFKPALPAALSVEVFHNFTLLHDDIMDAAPLRRGKETVHRKYGTNAGILSGDVMLIHAYRLLAEATPDALLPRVLGIFNDFAIGVCEGQQMDMNFEMIESVRIDEYLKMIELKTAVLFSGALQIGALLGGATEIDAQRLYDFARKVGVAFQLQDDILDTFGDPEKFGKKVGGDIVQNKKTYLYLRALEKGDEEQVSTLKQHYAHRPIDETAKIEAVKELFTVLQVREDAVALQREFQGEAMEALRAVSVPAERKIKLEEMAALMLGREV
jgi:geranylgeranyl diphosphate synthase type II